jgi:hypothetical protein
MNQRRERRSGPVFLGSSSKFGKIPDIPRVTLGRYFRHHGKAAAKDLESLGSKKYRTADACIFIDG